MKRKLLLVFLMLMLTVSLCLGATAAFAEGETEITWPEEFAATDWKGATELRISGTGPMEGNGGPVLKHTAEALAAVKITRGETEYKASHIYLWAEGLTFYFNRSNYNGREAVRGDILSVGAGFGFSYNDVDYICTEGKSFIYTGEKWIAGTELPAGAIELNWPEEFAATDWHGATELRITGTGPMKGNGGPVLQHSAEALAAVKITRGETEYKASHIYLWQDRLTFYFNRSNYNGTAAVRGDILSVGAGFGFSYNDADYICTEGKSFIYTGEKWIAGTELPEIVPVVIEGVKTAESTFEGNGFTFRVDLVTSAASLGLMSNLIDPVNTANVKYIRGENELSVGIFHGTNKEINMYFKNTDTFTFTNGVSLVGDKVVIGEGFGFSSTTDVSYTVTETVTYIYDGYNWIKNALPTVAEITNVETQASPFAGNGFKMMIAINTDVTVSLGNQTDIKNRTGGPIVYTRGGNSSTMGVAHGLGTVFRCFFRDSGDVLVFEQDVSLAGDMLTIQNPVYFTSSDGSVAYAMYPAEYIYTGSKWVEYVEPTAIDGADADVYIGTTKTVTFTATPSCEYAPLSYSIEGENAEIVRSNGLSVVVRGLSEGTAQLTATYGDITKTVTLTVSNEPQIIEVVVEGSVETYQYIAPDFSGLTAEYRYDNGDSESLTLTEDMFTFPDGYSYDVVGNYTVNVTYEGVTGSFNLVVKEATEITVEGVSLSVAWSALEVTFGGTANTESIGIGGADFDALRARFVPYVEVNLAALEKCELQANTPTLNSATALVWTQGATWDKYGLGDTVTFKKGLSLLEGEVLAQTITFVYNGERFVPLVEPDSFEIAADQNKNTYVGQRLQIRVDDHESVTAIYRYSVDNTELATIDAYGMLTALKAGTIIVTVSYGDVQKTVEITISPEQAKDSLVLEKPIQTYYVAKSTADAPTSFTQAGYTLRGYWLYLDGARGASFDIDPAWIGTIDYETTGRYELFVTINDGTADFSDTVQVEVFELAQVTEFKTVGVDGYDVNDDRNTLNTWNGHMIVGMDNVLVSEGNMLSTESCAEVANWIVYQTPDGKTYAGADGEIGIWQLGTMLLVMITPEGATTRKGFSRDLDIYTEGDRIIFKKGMPLYSNRKGEGQEGCLFIAGYAAEDIVYYCYEQDEDKSLWQIYRSYTDFNVDEAKKMSVGGTLAVGAIREPATATLGKFSFESSNPAVVTVTQDGNMIGMSVGSAVITVTLTGGVDADGNPMEAIVKTVTVTVERGVASITGDFTVQQNAEFVLSDYKLLVTYSDGATEEIALSDPRVIIQDVATDTVGTTVYNIRVEIDGEDIRASINVTVTGAGCNSVVGFAGLGSMLLLLAGCFVAKKK